MSRKLKTIFSAFLSLCCLSSFAQMSVGSAKFSRNNSIYDSLLFSDDWKDKKNAEFEPEFGSNWKQRILKVGERYNEKIIGQYLFDSMQTAQISDFENKLVILDFWATWCSTCIESFPKLEGLQRKFGDKIQIVLVNFWDTRSEIQKFFIKKNLTTSLPTLLGDKNLRVSFPTQFIPYHVWIDSEGTVQLIGSAINTDSAKISQFLTGRAITYLKDDNNAPKFVSSIPYYKILGIDHIYSKTFSFFAPFNFDYAVLSGGMIDRKFDSAAHTYRNTFVNYSLIDLYRYAFQNELKNNALIFSPFYGNIIIESIDTLDLTHQFLKYSELNDIDFVRSKYSYEQIVDENVSEDSMRKLMQNDLLDYFSRLRGIKAGLELRRVSGLNLVSVPSTSEAAKFEKYVKSVKFDSFTYAGIKVRKLKKNKLFDVVRATTSIDKIRKQLRSKFVFSSISNSTQETFVIPSNGSLEDLRRILRWQGVDLIEAEINMQFLVIKGSK